MVLCQRVVLIYNSGQQGTLEYNNIKNTVNLMNTTVPTSSILLEEHIKV